MKLGRKIGEGANSEVFEWGSNKVIKLAKPNTDVSALQREYKNNFTVWKMGLPVPQPFEVVEVDQRPGIIFERINGVSLTEQLLGIIMGEIDSRTEAIDWADIRITARLLSEIHQLSNNELRPQRDFLKWEIQSVNYLSDDEKKAVIRLLDSLPEKNKICHGDPNPNNILLCNGEPVFIDWNDATIGNPATDIAEFILVIRFTILPAETPEIIKRTFDSIRETIIQVFMDEYTGLTGTSYEEVTPWIIPIATRKLNADAISEEEKQLLVEEIRKRLAIIK